jgi:hypothetical protein
MHPVIFVLGLFVAGLFASMFTAMAIESHGVMDVGAALLFWLGAVALVWTRWVRKPVRWLVRVGAVVALAMLANTVYAWMPHTDVFVHYRLNRPPRTEGFWKVVYVWAGGVAAIHFSLFGKVVGTPRNALYWPGRVMVAAWCGACLYVFARNVSVDVVMQSIRAANALLIVIGIVAAIAVVFWLRSIPGRKREKQAAIDFAAIAPERRRELVAIVDRYARGVAHCMFYRDTGPSGWDVRKAHVGGSALMPANEAWPVDDAGQAARFLLQLPLPEALPAPWVGRSLALWILDGGFDVLARSYPSADVLIEVAQPPLPEDALVEPLSKGHLHPLALPVPQETDDELHGDAFCETLLQDCRELRDALSAVTDQPAALLPMLLQDQARAGSLDATNGVWVGGAPQLIQGAHDPECQHCKRPMRFLLSSGDFTDDMAFGDVGVVYLYGCDAHPEHCQAFVDCH